MTMLTHLLMWIVFKLIIQILNRKIYMSVTFLRVEDIDKGSTARQNLKFVAVTLTPLHYYTFLFVIPKIALNQIQKSKPRSAIFPEFSLFNF